MPSRQRGVVILMLILIVLSASSFVMLKALNANNLKQLKIDSESKSVLVEAKRALIGFAVGYAGTTDKSDGPGHLPCPDRAGGQPQGIAEPNCLEASGQETGRLPFRTLGLSELRDGSGAALWYAISDLYRSAAPAPLNSETGATNGVLEVLEVDSADDIVAVIIAPGAPLLGQSRGVNYYDPSAYLEDENASVGDGVFVTAASGYFNDTILTITRGELNAAMERVVLNEVANALDDYFDDPDGDGNEPCGATCDDGYPWLAAYTDPTVSTYEGEVGVTFGHLPLMEVGVPFDAHLTGTWDITGSGALVGSGSEPPDDTCVRSESCNQFFLFFELAGIPIGSVFNFPGPVSGFPGPVSGAPDATWNQGTCILNRNPTNLTCTATMDFTVSFFGLDRNIHRVYEFNLADNIRIERPTASDLRTMQMQEPEVPGNSWNGSTTTITVTDYEKPDMTVNGTKTLTFGNVSSGEAIDISGIPFDLEVSNVPTVDRELSPGELPNWIFANNWHHYVLVQYADAERPDDAATDCTSDTVGGCLTLNLRRPGAPTPLVDSNVRGVVVMAGADLANNRATPPPSVLGDYLELENASVDTTFEIQELSSVFNDQLITLPLQRP